MNYINSLIQGYEDTKLLHYGELAKNSPNLVPYSDLASREIRGVLKACVHIDGELYQMYSPQENHVGVIAATRMGKTTQYVIPTVLSFAKAKNKRSMVISDPKGELYRLLSKTLRNEGYKVKLINFRDFMHSEYWNPLTPIYDKYIRAYHLEDEVEVVDTPNGLRNKFMGVVYEDQMELDKAVKQMKMVAMEDVGNDIDNMATRFILLESVREPYWAESARDLLRAGVWAMLEDINPPEGVTPINRDTFSFKTLLSIMDNMKDDEGMYYNDDGYFSDRPKDSRAYILAKNCILENGKPTRKCIVSQFNTGLSIFKTSTVKLLTSCNSFSFDELTDESQPVVVFVSYMDELKTHYKIISAFVQSAYNHLIDYANNKPEGKLDTPFYFILDEFGNFPAIQDFETVISACGGRNIFFILILQSYAQLNNVYGHDISEIIRDNLNVHVFIGSNNPPTIQDFSRECGEWTRVAPISALNGSKEHIDSYHVETIPLVPKSMLSSLQIGECIVTEANCGYVMLSKLERYYLCDEFANLEKSNANDYVSDVKPLEDKYAYKYVSRKALKGARPRY